MKTTIYSGIASLIVILFSCNPSAGVQPISEIVKLSANISNHSETIALGDTLKIVLTLPDSVVSNIRTHPVQSLERAFFAMRTFRVDTVNKKGINMRFPDIWIPVGTTEGGFSYVFKGSNKPYQLVISFKPPEKGIYYFEVIPQPGKLIINKSMESNLLVNFGVLDRHLYLVAAHFSGQPFLDAANQQIAEGFGMYAFRVN